MNGTSIGIQISDKIIQELKRSDMPQLKDKPIRDVLVELEHMGIPYVKERVPCNILKFTQEDYSPNKVKQMVNRINTGDMNISELFTSDDYYIMDGHHRNLAYQRAISEDAIITIYRIQLPKMQALKMFETATNSESIVLPNIIIKEFLDNKLNELSTSGYSQVDDGPATFYRNINHFKDKTSYLETLLGFQIINYMVGDSKEYTNHVYRYNIVPVVSFGNDEDAIKKYTKRIFKIANVLGYKIIDYLDSKERNPNDTESNTPHTYIEN